MCLNSCIRYALVLMLCSLFPGAVDLHAQTYNFRNYSVENGLPFIQIYSIYQDNKGYLWSGGYGGLSRFDGNTFTNYSPKQGLANHYVSSITEDKENKLWVGTIEGISVLSENKFKTYTVMNGLPSNRINCLLRGRDGKIYIGTEKGLCCYSNNKFSLIKSLGSRNIKCLLYDQNNTLFAGTENGVYCIGQKTDSLLLPAKTVNTLVLGKEGKIWAGTTDGLVSFNTDLRGIINYGINNGLIDDNINCLNVDARNNLWIGTAGGLMKFNGKDFSYYKISADANANKIVSMGNDYEDNVWIGTHAGLFKFRDEGFVSFGPHDGLLNSLVFGIYRDHMNNLWVGTESGGLFKYSENIFSNYTARNGAPGDTVNCIIEDSENNLLAGGSGGISLLRKNSFTRLNILRNEFVHVFFRDKAGHVWAGLDGSVARLDIDSRSNKVSIRRYPLPTSVPGSQTWAFAEDNAGNIWIGTYQAGLFKFDGEKFIYQNSKLKIKSNDVLSLQYNKTDNRLYIASFEGIYELDLSTGAMEHFGEEDGLSSDLVYVMLLTNNGNTLWAGTNQGANKIDLGEFRNSYNKNIIAYGKAEGFRGVESNSNGIWQDKDGSVWFGTVNGLIKYNPANFTENLTESRLNITSMRLFYKDTLLPDRSELDYNQNNLSIHYIGICLTNPAKVRYIHKLEGFEKSWSPENAENYTTYSNLPPGRYTFKVKSCNNEGLWNTEPLTFSFVILQPYWQRWWFQLSLIILIVAVIILIFRLRLNQVKREQQKQTEQQIEISKNELKALRAQMNPHFMFNSLNSIQHYIINNKDDEAVFYLNKFAKLMRVILNNSEKPTVTIKEELDALKLYIELEQMRFQNKFTYEIKVDEAIDPDYEQVPTMLMQPYIENAILHGLTTKKEQGHLLIEIKILDKFLLCSITDNGIGRDKSTEMRRNRTKEHKSMGMKITQDRLKLLNTIYQSNLSLKINDLKAKDGLPLGTKVDIFIPIS
ncbi:MAG: two-component regulator propeller domain-containing protein [Bacteroidia bacterium]